MDIRAKIKTRESITGIRKELAEAGKTVVFTNGCFDILHRGHVEYLAQAREQGDALILGLNNDASVRRLKGSQRPILPEEDRAFILAGLAAIDYVVLFEEDTPLELISIIQPDILVKGGDYNVADIVGREVVEKRGGKVIVLPFVPNRSTTDIVQKITELVK